MMVRIATLYSEYDLKIFLIENKYIYFFFKLLTQQSNGATARNFKGGYTKWEGGIVPFIIHDDDFGTFQLILRF